MATSAADATPGATSRQPAARAAVASLKIVRIAALPFPAFVLETGEPDAGGVSPGGDPFTRGVRPNLSPVTGSVSTVVYHQHGRGLLRGLFPVTLTVNWTFP